MIKRGSANHTWRRCADLLPWLSRILPLADLTELYNKSFKQFHLVDGSCYVITFKTSIASRTAVNPGISGEAEAIWSAEKLHNKVI